MTDQYNQRQVVGSCILSKYLGGCEPSWPNQGTVDNQTIFTLASCTKLPTTVAALQLVEKQLIRLDTDVSNILPVLGRQKVLAGWNPDGSPILNKRRNPITLRHLLTHSSGAGYDFSNRDLEKFHCFRNTLPSKGSTIDERFDLPLLFEPGEGWEYGCGIDWAGKVVEQLSGTTLESYLRQNVWEPLGATSFTFWPKCQDKEGRRLAALTIKSETTGRLRELPAGLGLNIGVTDCFGGQGGYSNAADYTELLFSLLANDKRLLQAETVDMMFEAQLSKKSKEVLQAVTKDPSWAIGDFYPGEVYDWGLGGLLIEQLESCDALYARGPRTLVWSGAANLFWFIDRSKGLCGLFATQVLPSYDPDIEKLIAAFQEFVYKTGDS
ncbi:hypothetical protein NM208_g9599 [Fusarium decemcellulare]|uniref:Uncharacterized protein n=1 Tax=Fusarium decemcellulare TaxID=57161 RepID=A0ACC1S0Y5_9HYPO|nr:hypothetical protein NM208_g9599 [Fusarium decemcellulare]